MSVSFIAELSPVYCCLVIFRYCTFQRDILCSSRELIPIPNPDLSRICPKYSINMIYKVKANLDLFSRLVVGVKQQKVSLIPLQVILQFVTTRYNSCKMSERSYATRRYFPNLVSSGQADGCGCANAPRLNLNCFFFFLCFVCSQFWGRVVKAVI